ncbi:unnamed protein product [Symbiodinium pilosum]|uniref:Uncharacterized protein n=1 Tax=Symbiodinium pilosum TaxID=2952 RepID=A0A812R8G7_SYMPI|nr:unnamed protein product [Symbiodinium pilosum]
MSDHSELQQELNAVARENAQMERELWSMQKLHEAMQQDLLKEQSRSHSLRNELRRLKSDDVVGSMIEAPRVRAAGGAIPGSEELNAVGREKAQMERELWSMQKLHEAMQQDLLKDASFQQHGHVVLPSRWMQTSSDFKRRSSLRSECDLVQRSTDSLHPGNDAGST